MSTSAGLLFYIWIPISLSDCEVCWGPYSHSMGNLVTIPCDCMFTECGRKRAETRVFKERADPGVSKKQTNLSVFIGLTLSRRHADPAAC